MSNLNHQTLKTRHREERASFTENLNLRVHRALSWLDKAEQCSEDKDAQFIFLWISFNAAYANEVDDLYRVTEQETFRNFIDRLCELDGNSLLSELVWDEFASSIRVLLANQYVFKPFWDFHNGKLTEEEWLEKFKLANASANKALGNKNTEAVLSIIFTRLYTLRNQLLHGGATWNSGANREQVRDAVNFLSKFVPSAIDIMMDHGKQQWGDACYPVVD